MKEAHMPTPLVATPVNDSKEHCKECGSPLKLTGNPVTFGDLPATPRTSSVRGHRAYKGWVPSLLVYICPVCDSRKEPTEAEAQVETKSLVDEDREAYLNRLDPGRKNIGS